MSGDGRTAVALVIVRLGRGGAERILTSVANGLDPDRFHVHVIAIRDAGELAGELAKHVHLHALERHRPWDLASFLRFRALLRGSGIDIVHTHSHMAAYFVRIARGLGGARWSHVVHEHYPLIEHSRLRWLDRLCLSRVDHCFAASTRLAAYASRWIGIPADRCEALAGGIEPRAPAGRVEPEVFTVAQVARLAPQKDQLMALAVAARLRGVLPSFRWLFVGEAESRYGRRCRKAAAMMGLNGLVDFPGARADVDEILEQASVGVLTSRAEAAAPLALLEYMSAGLPVVTTSIGEADEIVQAASGGRVVAGHDVEAFAEALLGYAEDRSAAARAGAANRGYVERNYEAGAMVQRVAEVYEALATGSPRTPVGRR